MTETTAEQLAEIEGQATEYTPPEGWRVVQVGEVLRDGDLWVNHEGELWPTKRVGERVNDERYIRPIEPQPEPVQVREGRWRTRNGLVKDVTAMPTNHEDFAAAYPWWDGVSTWRNDGRWLAGGSTMDLLEYLGPIEADKTQELETKTQELETKTQELPEYTPPEGWRLVRFGELLLPGDEIVQIDDGRRYPTHRIGDAVGPNQQYIRRIKPEPQAESQPQPEPVQVREGRWRTRGGDIRNVTPRPAGDGRKDLFPWWDAAYGGTWTSGGRYYFGEESPSDLVEYLGPIEQQPEPEPEPVQVPGSGEQIRLLKDCNARQAELIADLKYERSGAMERAEVSARSNRKLTEQIEELRSEVSYVQNLLGESRQRVTQLEELVTSLRTINEAQEKAFNAAGKANTDLQHRLDTVAAEWATQAETSRRLQIELDAAQQVPQAIADRFEEGWNQGTARAVETIIAWLEPIRLADSAYLANATMQHLPSIMRHLTGLTQD